MLVIRKALNKPITVNNWASGGNFSQRSIRCNLCQIVKVKTNANALYMSSHVNGAGIDFDVKGMTAQEVRNWIITKKVLLP